MAIPSFFCVLVAECVRAREGHLLASAFFLERAGLLSCLLALFGRSGEVIVRNGSGLA